jgi:hypothetical protein
MQNRAFCLNTSALDTQDGSRKIPSGPIKKRLKVKGRNIFLRKTRYTITVINVRQVSHFTKGQKTFKEAMNGKGVGTGVGMEGGGKPEEGVGQTRFFFLQN